MNLGFAATIGATLLVSLAITGTGVFLYTKSLRPDWFDSEILEKELDKKQSLMEAELDSFQKPDSLIKKSAYAVKPVDEFIKSFSETDLDSKGLSINFKLAAISQNTREDGAEGEEEKKPAESVQEPVVNLVQPSDVGKDTSFQQVKFISTKKEAPLTTSVQIQLIGHRLEDVTKGLYQAAAYEVKNIFNHPGLTGYFLVFERRSDTSEDFKLEPTEYAFESEPRFLLSYKKILERVNLASLTKNVKEIEDSVTPKVNFLRYSKRQTYRASIDSFEDDELPIIDDRTINPMKWLCTISGKMDNLDFNVYLILAKPDVTVENSEMKWELETVKKSVSDSFMYVTNEKRLFNYCNSCAGSKYSL